jgi:beta-lactamase class A
MNLLKVFGMFVIALAFMACAANKTENELKTELEKLISSAHADIGISIIETGSNDKVDINGDVSFPMLSTVKIPLALAVLSRVEKGAFPLDQQVLISSEALRENTYSPFKKLHPEGDISITLEEALKWVVVDSDNNITDVLFKLLGGPDAVAKFMNNEDFVIKNNEDDMHQNWDAQFVNTATPNAYTQLLKSFSDGEILNEEHTEWLYKAMVKSNTGVRRLKGKLPNITIAQRAGTSFTNDEGITGAINNVGIMELPNNRKIFISVFIHNTSDGFENGEALIAEIAKASYDFYIKK